MPNVVVYVPAAAWRLLEARGVDPAETVREFAKRAYDIAPPVVADSQPCDVPARTIVPADDHFKTDFK